MEEPAIHFDRLMGSKPAWRECVTEALQGHPAALDREFLALTGYSPTQARMLAAAFAYAFNGQQCFVLGPRLQSMFEDTECSGVPKEFVRFPFDCFYVAVPETNMTIWGGERSKEHTVGGFYIHRKAEGIFTLVIWGKENAASRFVGDDASLWIDLNLADAPTKDGNIDFEAYLEWMLASGTQQAPDAGMGDIPEESRLRHLQSAISCLRLGLNLVLYMNSLEPEVDKDDARIKNKREAQGLLNQRLSRQGKTGKGKGKGKKGKKKPLSKKDLRERQNIASMSEAIITWIGQSIEKAPVSREGSDTKRTKGTGQWTNRRGHFHFYWVGSRTDPETGNPRKGTHRVSKWVKPIRRDMARIAHARGRQYRFREEKGDFKAEQPKPENS